MGIEEESEIKDLIIANLKADLDRGAPVCSKDVSAWLKNERNINISKKFLLKYLQNWGINWRRLKVDECWKAKSQIMILKTEFLQSIVNKIIICNHKRECKYPSQKQFVFIDESYVHEHHVSEYGLGLNDYPLQKPQGKGRRIAIAAAITEDDWLGAYLDADSWKPDNNKIYENGSIRCWIANFGGDYHSNFNSQNFISYFENYILKYLRIPSVLACRY